MSSDRQEYRPHTSFGSRDVVVVRTGDLAGVPLAPRLAPTPPGAGGRVNAWIVMALIVATTVLATYDLYVLLAFATR